MTAVWVPTEAIVAARDRAAALGPNPVEQQRWQRTVAYALQRGPDPSPARREALQRLLGTEEGADRCSAELLTQYRAWLADDIASAAPLLELFTGHHRDPEGGPPQPDPALVSKLREWLVPRVGDSALGATVTVLAGGFSRLMFDLRWDGGHGVVRLEQDGMFATEGAREIAVMNVMAQHGYPVPPVLWSEEDASVLGAPFFVMAHVEGAARTDGEALDHMLRSVADLHALAPSAADAVGALDGVSAGSSPPTVLEAQLAHWHSVYRSAVHAPIPLLEHGFAWLRENLPLTGRPVVVHGDPGPGNVLQDAAGVTAVLDWELAHAGDAAEDWAYLVLIRGRKIAGPDEWKARLLATVGIDYDERTWLAWEAYNSVKGACVNLTALDVFQRTARPTPDMLAIGVAVHLRFLARVVELTCPPEVSDE